TEPSSAYVARATGSVVSRARALSGPTKSRSTAAVYVARRVRADRRPGRLQAARTVRNVVPAVTKSVAVKPALPAHTNSKSTRSRAVRRKAAETSRRSRIPSANRTTARPSAGGRQLPGRHPGQADAEVPADQVEVCDGRRQSRRRGRRQRHRRPGGERERRPP